MRYTSVARMKPEVADEWVLLGRIIQLVTVLSGRTGPDAGPPAGMRTSSTAHTIEPD